MKRRERGIELFSPAFPDAGACGPGAIVLPPISRGGVLVTPAAGRP